MYAADRSLMPRKDGRWSSPPQLAAPLSGWPQTWEEEAQAPMTANSRELRNAICYAKSTDEELQLRQGQRAIFTMSDRGRWSYPSKKMNK